jgi:hypothetical protein
VRVYVVLVDWGTNDGRAQGLSLHDVFANRQHAEESLEACKSRTPYPALYGKVEWRDVRGR